MNIMKLADAVLRQAEQDRKAHEVWIAEQASVARDATIVDLTAFINEDLALKGAWRKMNVQFPPDDVLVERKGRVEVALDMGRGKSLVLVLPLLSEKVKTTTVIAERGNRHAVRTTIFDTPNIKLAMAQVVKEVF